MTAATHSEFSIKSNFCLKDIPTSPGLCFDEEKVHNRWCRDSKSITFSFRSISCEMCFHFDQGTHFTGQVVKEVSRMLKIKWNLHCPYRPQASGSVANIYTDSRYAFGVIHDFGVIWQTRKFLTSAGSPIKHAGLVKDLMFAMKIPKKLAVKTPS